MNKLSKVLVLEGGKNEEHKVSLNTASEVKKILRKKKIIYKSLVVDPNNFEKKISKFSNKMIIFNALHGTYGEDGKIQKILKKNKFKFTHSGVFSSKICFNKIRSKEKLIKAKIPTPNFQVYKSKLLNAKNLEIIKKKYNKFVIKPAESGSSFAVSVIKNNNDYKKLLLNLKNYTKIISNHDPLIIEEYIDGVELTVSVFEIEKKLKALEVTEILTKNSFFDYKSKYTKGYSKHIIPARISKKIYNQCLNYALKAHKILKCNVLSRSDFIYNLDKQKLYYLETNTQPGLTPISLVPEQANFKNISFDKIVLELIKNYNE